MEPSYDGIICVNGRLSGVVTIDGRPEGVAVFVEHV